MSTNNDKLFKAIMYIVLLFVAAGILCSFCSSLLSQKSTLLNIIGYISLAGTVVIFAIVFGKIVNKIIHINVKQDGRD